MEHMMEVFPLDRDPEWFSCIAGTDHQCIQADKHKLDYDCLCDKQNQFRMYLDMDQRIYY